MPEQKKMKYKTKPLECWGKGKELLKEIYLDYLHIKDRGGIRWCGSGWALDPLPYGLGDVASLKGEPYGAVIAGTNPDFSVKCMEAHESRGFARDLCSYLRNYWGSMFLNKFYIDGKFYDFPKPDFCFTSSICCTHAKWYQQVAEYENVPYYGLDLSLGVENAANDNMKEYLVNQCHEAIEWMAKVTGIRYDDERLIEGVNIDCECTSLWTEICCFNKAVPAPLDEKTMFSLYALIVLTKVSKKVLDFYKELRDEVEDRVKNQIAAVGNEQKRILGDSQPPWSLLGMYRYMEKYGAVSLGSLYTFTLGGVMEIQEDGTLGPAITPKQKGIEFKTRDEALRFYADWTLKKSIWHQFYGSEEKSKLMFQLIKEWKADGVLLHLNRGCEGTSIGIMENYLALQKAGIPIVTYEGNMADARECDRAKTYERIDTFLEMLGLKE